MKIRQRLEKSFVVDISKFANEGNHGFESSEAKRRETYFKFGETSWKL